MLRVFTEFVVKKFPNLMRKNDALLLYSRLITGKSSVMCETCEFRTFSNCVWMALNRKFLRCEFSTNYHSSNDEDSEDDLLVNIPTYDAKNTYKQRCIQKISTHLKVSEREATQFMKQYPILFVEELDNSIQRYYFLMENCALPEQVIRKNLWVLALSENEAREKLRLLKSWNVPERTQYEMLRFLQLPKQSLYKLTHTFSSDQNTCPSNNRILFLAEILQCSVREVVDMCMSHKNILFKPFEPTRIICELLLENGCSGEDILRDPWVFQNAVQHVNDRIKRAKSANIKIVRPWMIRTPEDKFQRTLKIHEDEHRTLKPTETREEFLAQRLAVDDKIIRVIYEKYPTVKGVNVLKLKETIDYLYSRGYSNYDICTTPRVFLNSVQTLKNRHAELTELGYSPSLSLLVKNRSDYQKLLEKILYKKSIENEITSEQA